MRGAWSCVTIVLTQWPKICAAAACTLSPVRALTISPCSFFVLYCMVYKCSSAETEKGEPKRFMYRPLPSSPEGEWRKGRAIPTPNSFPPLPSLFQNGKRMKKHIARGGEECAICCSLFSSLPFGQVN